MKIWIMRHGEAGFNASSDSERNLTKKGETDAFNQGKRLAERLPQHLDKIIVSPYLRTQQTLEKLIEGMQAVNFEQSFANIVETWQGITPDGDIENVISYLAFLKEEGAKNILIISHLPLVYDLVQALTDYQGSVKFYPAVIAEIDWSKPQGKLIATLAN